MFRLTLHAKRHLTMTVQMGRIVIIMHTTLTQNFPIMRFTAMINSRGQHLHTNQRSLFRIITIFNTRLIKTMSQRHTNRIQRLTIRLHRLNNTVLVSLTRRILSRTFSRHRSLVRITITGLRVRLQRLRRIILKILSFNLFRTGIQHSSRSLIITLNNRYRLFVRSRTHNRFRTPLFMLSLNKVRHIIR